MRSGRLDYETGKWVDDLPPLTVAQPPIIPSPPPVIHAVPPPITLVDPAQASAADKARLILQQRQGRQ